MKPKPRQFAEARGLQSSINEEIKNVIGAVLPFTETYDFQADEQTDIDLASLFQDELVDRLLSARGAVTEAPAETERGYWAT